MVAKKKQGSEYKQPLTQSPSILEFKYGASTEGHWTYDGMVLELEECADIVKTLYPQCGHDHMP
jgi:hypothetical protein